MSAGRAGRAAHGDSPLPQRGDLRWGLAQALGPRALSPRGEVAKLDGPDECSPTPSTRAALPFPQNPSALYMSWRSRCFIFIFHQKHSSFGTQAVRLAPHLQSHKFARSQCTRPTEDDRVEDPGSRVQSRGQMPRPAGQWQGPASLARGGSSASERECFVSRGVICPHYYAKGLSVREARRPRVAAAVLPRGGTGGAGWGG